jgi:hypothetical protein
MSKVVDIYFRECDEQRLRLVYEHHAAVNHGTLASTHIHGCRIGRGSDRVRSLKRSLIPRFVVSNKMNILQ